MHNLSVSLRGVLAISIGLLSTINGCIDTSPIDRAVSVIDSGIHDIRSESASWQNVLNRVATQLPQEISQTIRTDAQNLASRSIAKTGIEFRCDVDFLSRRAISSLEWLKAKLRDGKAPPPPPEFCHVVPEAIDLSSAPGSWSVITYHGYDLDYQDANHQPLQLLLTDAQGHTAPLPEDRIGRTTHYQVTVNLGALASRLFHEHTTKLVVAWGASTLGPRGEPYPQVVIVPWQAKQRTEHIDPGTTGKFIPPRVHGDADFDTDDGNPMQVGLQAEIRVTDQVVEGRTFLRAREHDPDHTEVSGWSPWARLYTAPPKTRILDVRPRSPSSQVATIISHGEQTFPRPAGEVARRFHVFGDRDGDEAGIWTGVEVDWNPFDISLIETAPEWLN